MAAKKSAKRAAQTRTRDSRGDMTGQRAKESAKAAEEERKEAATRMAMITAEEEAKEHDDSEVGNYTDEPVTEEEVGSAVSEVALTPEEPKPTYEKDEVQTAGPTELLKSSTEIIRAREDCQFTLGYGNKYQFTAGRRYKVPTHVAKHMEEKGLLW